MYTAHVADRPEYLVLLFDDPYAARLLAWWDKVKPVVPPDTHELGALLGAPHTSIKATIARCELAGVVTLGRGISDTGRKYLQSLVSKQLGVGRKPARSDSRGSTMVAALALAAMLALTYLGAGMVGAWTARNTTHSTPNSSTSQT